MASIFKAKSRGAADIRVKEVKTRGEADILVYKEKSKGSAWKKDDLWHEAKTKGQATKSMYEVDSKGEADLLVHYVDTRGEAGWRKDHALKNNLKSKNSAIYDHSLFSEISTLVKAFARLVSSIYKFSRFITEKVINLRSKRKI